MRPRGWLASVAFAIAVSAPMLGAQPAVPNFSGRWEMNAAKSDFGQIPAPSKLTMTIEQTATTIKSTQVMSSPNGDLNMSMDFALDGSPTQGSGIGGATTSSTAKIDTTGLATATKLQMGGNEMNQTSKWTLSPDGKVLTVTQGMTGPMGELAFRIVLDKQP